MVGGKIAINESITFINRSSFQTKPVHRRRRLLLVNKLEGDNISMAITQLLLQQAVVTPPEKQRLAFQMKYFNELKYDEMSDTAHQLEHLKHHIITQ